MKLSIETLADRRATKDSLKERPSSPPAVIPIPGPWYVPRFFTKRPGRIIVDEEGYFLAREADYSGD